MLKKITKKNRGKKKFAENRKKIIKKLKLEVVKRWHAMASARGCSCLSFRRGRLLDISRSDSRIGSVSGFLCHLSLFCLILKSSLK